MTTLPDVIIVTGTDTGVGKTIVTAAVASVVTKLGGGSPVAVHKLVQTGTDSIEHGDAASIATLTWSVGRVECSEGVRYLAPMAPRAAAAFEDRELPPLDEHADYVAELAETSHVIVEGSGGLLVELDSDGGTLADLPKALTDYGLSAGFIVVCRSGLGTLNHTALTVEALKARGANILGLVVGSWPSDPDQIDITNLEAMARIAPVLGAVHEGVSDYPSHSFVAKAHKWLPGFLTAH